MQVAAVKYELTQAYIEIVRYLCYPKVTVKISMSVYMTHPTEFQVRITKNLRLKTFCIGNKARGTNDLKRHKTHKQTE